MAEINKDLSTAKIVAVSYDKRNKMKYKYLTNLDVSLGDVVKTPTGSAVVVEIDAKKYGNYKLDWLEGIILHNEGDYSSSLDLFNITGGQKKAKIRMKGNARKFGDIVIPKCDGKPITLLSGGFAKKIRKLTIPENVELVEEGAFGVGEISQYVINCSRSFDVILDSALRMYIVYEYIKNMKAKDKIPPEYLKFMSENLGYAENYFKSQKFKDVFFSPEVINSSALFIQKYRNHGVYKQVFTYIFDNFETYKKDKIFMSKLYDFISSENENRIIGYDYNYPHYEMYGENKFSFFIQFLRYYSSDNLKEVLSNSNVKFYDLTDKETDYIARNYDCFIGTKYELLCRKSIKKRFYYEDIRLSDISDYIEYLKTNKLN